LADFIEDNKSVSGFMIEYAVLSSIRTKGLAIGEDIGTPMKLERFEESQNFDTKVRDMPVLYRPETFNFRAIDGIIVLVKPKRNAKGKNQPRKPKMFMFPFRIAVAGSHSGSHEKFFELYYNKWTKELSNFDVEIQFL